jgi:hypothetical protein
MITLRRLLSTYLGAISLNIGLGVAVVAGQVAVLLMLTPNYRASAEGDQSADY